MNDTRQTEDGVILDAVTATGWSTETDVSNQQNVQIGIAVTGACTVKIAGSILDKGQVDFSSAQSPSNMWDYVAVYDLEDSSLITGDDGIVFAGADCRTVTLNQPGLKSVAVQVSAYTGGAVTARILAVNNN